MEWFSVLVIEWVKEVDSVFISFVRKVSVETILDQILQLGFGNILLINLEMKDFQFQSEYWKLRINHISYRINLNFSGSKKQSYWTKQLKNTAHLQEYDRTSNDSELLRILLQKKGKKLLIEWLIHVKLSFCHVPSSCIGWHHIEGENLKIQYTRMHPQATVKVKVL